MFYLKTYKHFYSHQSKIFRRFYNESSSLSKAQFKAIKKALKCQIVGLDCEFVECISQKNCLARCSIVDYNLNVIEDLYVTPPQKVIDYRYKYSGITPKKLYSSYAIGFDQAKERVSSLIDSKIVIGHSLWNDSRVLELAFNVAIDISLLKSLRSKMLKLGHHRESRSSYGLKLMAKELLHLEIQTKTHCSIEDAATAVRLFKLVENDWVYANQNKLILENF